MENVSVEDELVVAFPNSLSSKKVLKRKKHNAQNTTQLPQGSCSNEPGNNYGSQGYQTNSKEKR